MTPDSSSLRDFLWFISFDIKLLKTVQEDGIAIWSVLGRSNFYMSVLDKVFRTTNKPNIY